MTPEDTKRVFGDELNRGHSSRYINYYVLLKTYSYTFANAAIWLTIIRSQMTLYHNVAGYSAIAPHFGLKVDLNIFIVYM